MSGRQPNYEALSEPAEQKANNGGDSGKPATSAGPGGPHPAAGRTRCQVFCRLKEIDDVGVADGAFTCRFRYWAYFSDPKLQEALAAAGLNFAHARGGKTGKSHLVSSLPAEVKVLVPRLSLHNRKDDNYKSAGVELKGADPTETGFDFYITDNLDAKIACHYDLRQFPFDHHQLKVELALKKLYGGHRHFLVVSPFKPRSLSHTYEDDVRLAQGNAPEELSIFRDAYESIPFLEAGTDAALRLKSLPLEVWDQLHLSPLELEQERLAEWWLYSPLLFERPYKRNSLQAGAVRVEKRLPYTSMVAGQARQPHCTFCVTVSRLDEWYLRDIMVMNSCIATLAFGTAFIPSAELGDRLAILTTLLLTGIAFSLMVNDRLPKVPYGTVLSGHIKVSAAMFFGLTAIQSLSAAISPQSELHGFSGDSIAHTAAFACWALYHVGFAVQVSWKRARRKQHCGERHQFRHADDVRHDERRGRGISVVNEKREWRRCGAL